jgi:hypothetical protein
MCTLKVQKIKTESATIPSPRLNPFLEFFGTDIYATSGQEHLSCTAVASSLNDMWCFSIRKNQWSKVSLPSLGFSGVKSICADKEKMIILSKYPQLNCQVLKIPSLQIVKFQQFNSSRIPLGVR